MPIVCVKMLYYSKYNESNLIQKRNNCAPDNTSNMVILITNIKLRNFLLGLVLDSLGCIRLVNKYINCYHSCIFIGVLIILKTDINTLMHRCSEWHPAESHGLHRSNWLRKI